MVFVTWNCFAAFAPVVQNFNLDRQMHTHIMRNRLLKGYISVFDVPVCYFSIVSSESVGNSCCSLECIDGHDLEFCEQDEVTMRDYRLHRRQRDESISFAF